MMSLQFGDTDPTKHETVASVPGTRHQATALAQLDTDVKHGAILGYNRIHCL